MSLTEAVGAGRTCCILRKLELEKHHPAGSSAVRWSLKSGHEEKKTSFHHHSKCFSLVPVTIAPAALRPTSGRKEPEIICQLHVESFPRRAKVINAD